MISRRSALALAAAALSLTGTGAAQPSAPVRPQTPRPPFPYDAEEISVVSRADGARLAGTLTHPRDARRAPAVLLLSVAGPNDRDMSFAGHAAYAVLADRLTRRGFAVLRLDDRGVGGSEGDWSCASYETLRDDAVSAIEFLRASTNINADCVGVFGLSEGAAIAAMAAAAAPVAFTVLASPPGLPGEASLRLQFERMLNAHGVSGDQAAAYRQGFEQFVGLARAAAVSVERRLDLERFLAGPGRTLVPPYAFVPRDAAGQARLFSGAWYQSQLALDPAASYAQLRMPALVIGGSLDLILPPGEHHAAIRAAKPDAEFAVIDGVSHLLQPTLTGAPQEYASTDVTLDARVLDTVERWLLAQTCR